MKSIWYEALGSAKNVLLYGERPDPVAGDGEVLIEVYASGINPSDVKARAGSRAGKNSLDYEFIIPHSDGSGVVAAIGAGVTRHAVGDRVWFCNAQWQRSHGSAAEWVALNEQLVFPLPDNTSFETGAALGIPALTACHATTGFGPIKDKVVLVSGGAGTVGRLAVQFAKHAGSFVVVSGRSALDKAGIFAAGADAYVEFTSSTLAADILAVTGGRKVDHVVEVEFGKNIDAVADVAAEHCTIAAYGSMGSPTPPLPFYRLLFKAIRLEFVLVYSLSEQERRVAASHINSLLGSNKLQVSVHSAFPMKDCAFAHELVESGERAGSIVLNIKKRNAGEIEKWKNFQFKFLGKYCRSWRIN